MYYNMEEHSGKCLANFKLNLESQLLRFNALKIWSAPGNNIVNALLQQAVSVLSWGAAFYPSLQSLLTSIVFILWHTLPKVG